MHVEVQAHPVSGEVVNPSRKEGYGTIRVDSETVTMENGYLNKERRSAFINGKIEDLKSMGFQAGSKLRGIIQKQKSSKPFYENQEEAINPSTGEKLGYYLQYRYTENVDAPKNIEVSNVVMNEVTEGVEANA